MTTTDGNPASGSGTGGDAGTQTPRDGDDQQQSGTQTSRNATDDAARDGRSDGDDDLDTVDDPKRLREMIREMRTHERRRNEGYNTLRSEHTRTQERLSALEREKQQGAPAEERLQQLERDLEAERQKNKQFEESRKEERTNHGIVEAAKRLNAVDPEDVARLIDRKDLTIEEDGTAPNAEQVVRAFLKRKPHLVRTSAGGGADGGTRGSSGKGDSSDMNALLRGARRGRVAPGGKDAE